MSYKVLKYDGTSPPDVMKFSSLEAFVSWMKEENFDPDHVKDFVEYGDVYDETNYYWNWNDPMESDYTSFEESEDEDEDSLKDTMPDFPKD